jgi:hypothetical protein
VAGGVRLREAGRGGDLVDRLRPGGKQIEDLPPRAVADRVEHQACIGAPHEPQYKPTLI